VKKGKLIGMIAITAGLLTGCIDHMPEMTEEQSALIAEYASDLLLKYSPNYQYKLADEEDFIEEASVIEETTEEVMTEEVTEEQSLETVETIEVSVKTKEEIENLLDVTDIAEVDVAEVFEVEDVKIRYMDMEICSDYPQGESGNGFSMSAMEGNSLVVLHMLIENTSEAVITCDLFEKDFDISMNINGGNFKKASQTLIVNDFTTYMEEIPAGESREAVIVVEMNEIAENEMNSCMLRISTDKTSMTAKLK